MKKEDSILVAIYCIAYNQENYIRDCLEGFVIQKADFSFVAIVHDDCSTDKTATILREYAEKYPDIIKPIYETENQWSKNDGSLNHIMYDAISATGAKYVAMCEGDDYWTDQLKLQKQVDYMEDHPECAICFHPVMVLDQKTGKISSDTLTTVPAKTTIIELAKLSNYMRTPSVMYRYFPEINHRFESLGRVGVGDYLQHMLYAQHGYIYQLPDCMAVYRKGVGIWSGPNTADEVNYIKWILAVAKLSVIIPDEKVKDALDEQINSIVSMLIQNSLTTKQQLFGIQHSKAYRLGKLLLKPFKWLKK